MKNGSVGTLAGTVPEPLGPPTRGAGGRCRRPGVLLFAYQLTLGTRRATTAGTAGLVDETGDRREAALRVVPELDGKRLSLPVDSDLVDLEMKMGAGREAGVAGQADQITGLDNLPDSRRPAVPEVGVNAKGSVSMLDYDSVVAFELAVACSARDHVVDDFDDRSTARGQDRRAPGQREVEGVGAEPLVAEAAVESLANRPRCPPAEGHPVVPGIIVYRSGIAAKHEPSRVVGMTLLRILNREYSGIRSSTRLDPCHERRGLESVEINQLDRIHYDINSLVSLVSNLKRQVDPAPMSTNADILVA